MSRISWYLSHTVKLGITSEISKSTRKQSYSSNMILWILRAFFNLFYDTSMLVLLHWKSVTLTQHSLSKSNKQNFRGENLIIDNYFKMKTILSLTVNQTWEIYAISVRKSLLTLKCIVIFWIYWTTFKFLAIPEIFTCFQGYKFKLLKLNIVGRWPNYKSAFSLLISKKDKQKHLEIWSEITE